MNSKEVEIAAIESGGVHVIVVESVAALVPNTQIEGDMGEPHVALQTHLMPQSLRKLASPVGRPGHGPGHICNAYSSNKEGPLLIGCVVSCSVRFSKERGVIGRFTGARLKFFTTGQFV
jgi:hypothetical protein